jgi:hypothetical protein
MATITHTALSSWPRAARLLVITTVLMLVATAALVATLTLLPVDVTLGPISIIRHVR